MSDIIRKTTDEKEIVSEVPKSCSNRETLGGTCHTTMTTSMSLPSLTSVSSSSAELEALVDEDEEINPLEEEIEEYEDEYSLYLLRVLQLNILQNEGEEELAKNCLISQQKEYEDLLLENTALYTQVKEMEIHLKSLQKLEENLSRVQKLLKVLKVTEFDGIVQKFYETSVANRNRLKLVTLTREDIDEAFSKNLLGFESVIYKLLKKMENHAAEHEALLPEIVEKLNEIRSLHAENEKLKMRFTIHANQLRRKTIVSDWEKYFRIATEECTDILDKTPDNGIPHSFEDESLMQRACECGEPAASSTPTSSLASTKCRSTMQAE